MAFALQRLIELRPHLYHLTAASNLSSIVKTKSLRSADLLLADAGMMEQSSQRRLDHLNFRHGHDSVQIRDQKPLIEGAIDFEEGWNISRLVQFINQHVFFWPGNHAGPIGAGVNHFERYRSEAPVILRLATADLLDKGLKFSRYNSGAPRCSGGRYSPRGSMTYVPALNFLGTASEVVEVVVFGDCPLPATAEVSTSPAGPWSKLCSAA